MHFLANEKSETRMTASAVTQDPTTYKKGLKRTVFITTKQQHANFRGRPLFV